MFNFGENSDFLVWFPLQKFYSREHFYDFVWLNLRRRKFGLCPESVLRSLKGVPAWKRANRITPRLFFLFWLSTLGSFHSYFVQRLLVEASVHPPRRWDLKPTGDETQYRPHGKAKLFLYTEKNQFVYFQPSPNGFEGWNDAGVSSPVSFDVAANLNRSYYAGSSLITGVMLSVYSA